MVISGTQNFLRTATKLGTADGTLKKYFEEKKTPSFQFDKKSQF